MENLRDNIIEFQFSRPNRAEDERKLIDIISNFKGVTSCVIVIGEKQKIVVTGRFNLRKLWEKILKNKDIEHVDVLGVDTKSEIIQKNDLEILTEKLENFEMVQEDVTKVEDIAEHKELE